jgi:hypothetical protein
MSEQSEDGTYSNDWLKPYLQAIHDAGAVDKSETDDLFREVYTRLAGESADEDFPEYQGASKIRQTMYIAKLAKSAGEAVMLTEKGNEFIGAE